MRFKRSVTPLARQGQRFLLDIFVLGALAKSFTTVVTYPLQVAQSLMRVQHKSPQENPARSSSLAGCLAQIYADRGVAGYFAGLQAKLLQTVLTAAISWSRTRNCWR